jgi:SAM-dependent methyltransferase
MTILPSAIQRGGPSRGKNPGGALAAPLFFAPWIRFAKAQLVQTFHRALREINERIMFPRRYAFLAEALSPFLAGARSVLDVGSSNGRLIRRLTAGLEGARVVGVVQPNSVIPIECFDGMRLPFADGAFDSVVLIDVLHHADDPPALLIEAARVAKNHVLIKDHYFRNRLEWLILKWADYGGNAPHGIRLPCNYLSLEAWQAAFRRAGLSVLTEKRFTRYSYDPCQHVIFHLQKPDALASLR